MPTILDEDMAQARFSRVTQVRGRKVLEIARGFYRHPKRKQRLILQGIIHIGLPAFYQGIQDFLGRLEGVFCEGLAEKVTETKFISPEAIRQAELVKKDLGNTKKWGSGKKYQA